MNFHTEYTTEYLRMSYLGYITIHNVFMFSTECDCMCYSYVLHIISLLVAYIT